MPTAEQSRLALRLVTTAAVDRATGLVTASAADTRAALLDVAPDLVAYYSDGSAALAADYYDDARDAAGPRRRFTAEPVVNPLTTNLENGIAWASAPMFAPEPDPVLTRARVAEVIQLETARPYRDTITTNRRRDPSARGWRRITGGGCKFCRMLADRGAVYKETTARFAAHGHCHCSAEPVFEGQGGQEASVLQYVASQRRRTPAQRQALREYLAALP